MAPTAVAPFVAQALAQTGGGDAEILNFALTLEYLESAFYTVKGKEVGLSGQAKTYAKEFGMEEEQHVAALTGAIKELGAKPVARCPLSCFPGTNEKSFLALASVLENTGVGAYNGAAPSLEKQARCSVSPAASCRWRRATRRRSTCWSTGAPRPTVDLTCL